MRRALENIAGERNLESTPGELLEVMRTWYNGYRFVESAEDLVYNPTNALYFLEHLAEFGTPPDALHDQNPRTDRGKLAFLARTSAGSGVIERLTEGDGTLEITRLETSFSLGDLLTQVGAGDLRAARRARDGCHRLAPGRHGSPAGGAARRGGARLSAGARDRGAAR